MKAGLMPIHNDLINAARKNKSLKHPQLNEASRAIGLGLIEIHDADRDAADKFDELLRKLDEVEKKRSDLRMCV
ncbi:hypothetical protein DEA98_22615 [Brucella pseudogrignonensis]|nr:hypothetical protein [Brucella pseudogrignonensis]